ncbi:phospholipid scramblase 2 [Galendromus occidentalis]|uniref:Phospholipid scramblase n=1 Tax=Galendromus occidentalis TaxID=34638 RepID=A0AAJ6VXZ5_9ACAR|nr:phospholipid scramblase 2 [Galendromus occidentalis]
MDPKRLPSTPAGFVPPDDRMFGSLPPPYSAAVSPTYAPPAGPVQSVPMPGQMPMPQPGPAPPPIGVNPGEGPLGYLAAVDQLLIKQEIHLVEVVANVQTNVKFDILNNQGQLVYRAEENSEFCQRNCGGPARGFTIFIKDLMGSDVIALRRDCRCCGCCFPCCCLQEMIVEAPPGYCVGRIKEDWTFCTPSFTIRDERDEAVYKVSSRCCPGAKGLHINSDVHFKVEDVTSSHEIGHIVKEWGGVIQEIYTRATNFNVSFPMHLCVQHKAILLSVAFLLNFMYFQQTPAQFRGDHHPGPSPFVGTVGGPQHCNPVTTTTSFA